MCRSNACKKELDILGDWEKNLVASYFDTPYTVTPDITVEEGDTFSAAGFTWQVFETPGHTIGSCCYYIEKEKVLFSGDTLFSGSYGRTDLPTGSGRMMIGSVTRLLKIPSGGCHGYIRATWTKPPSAMKSNTIPWRGF